MGEIGARDTADRAGLVPLQTSVHQRAGIRQCDKAKSVLGQFEPGETAEMLARSMPDEFADQNGTGFRPGGHRNQKRGRDHWEESTAAHALGKSAIVYSRGVFLRGPVCFFFFGGFLSSSR